MYENIQWYVLYSTQKQINSLAVAFLQFRVIQELKTFLEGHSAFMKANNSLFDSNLASSIQLTSSLHRSPNRFLYYHRIHA
jgi:hypothetical protein